MCKRSENIVHRLFSRQISRDPPNTHFHRARSFYENVVPSHTVYEVDCPDQWWRRFTNDGQYLVCFSRSSQDVLIYRPLWLSYQSRSELEEELPANANKFESHFTLLHRIPLATGVNEVICKDFFLSTENNAYGIFATSTAPYVNPPAATGAIAGVPCIEKITFVIVRLADGVVTARSVFQDDYIHLAHNAGVFLHDDLLAILSVRFQRIHILQIRDGGLFLDVRTIGEFCREDDELLLNSQAQEEAQYQEQIVLRKAKGVVGSDVAAPAGVSASQAMSFWGSKPWRALMSDRRPHLSSQDPRSLASVPSGTTAAPSHSGWELDSLYEGYFRGLFSNGSPRPHGSSLENVHVWRFEEGGNHTNINNNTSSVAGRHLLLGGEYSSYEEAFGAQAHSGVGVDLNGRQAGFEGLGGRGEYAAYEGVSRNGSSSHSLSSSSSDTRDALSLSVASVQAYEGFFSPGQHRTRPVPTRFSDGSVSRRAESSLSREEPHPAVSGPGPPGPGTLPSRPAGGEDGDSGVTGAPARGGDSHGDGLDGRPVQEEPQPSGQILGGLKHRLLSFILQCIQNEDTTPGIKAHRLKRFYYHYQHYVNLVMWKVQFLDRCHLLIKFGSVDGLLSRNSETSNQTAFLAVYNMETTDMLGFYQNSSEELMQCVERYSDHFRMAPQYPLYMNFISSYSNNAFTREQLQKQMAVSVNSKAGTYSQVVKRTLASLPHNSQSQSPSPYFDQYLFQYDEKLISATDRHKPCMEHPIKFISRRRPNTLKFKINPGAELGSNDGHIKRVASFFFHPIYPFVISVQQSFMQTTIVNFHFRK